MWGRFAFQPTKAFFEQCAVSGDDLKLTPRYNIAPGQMVPVVVREDEQLMAFAGLYDVWKDPEGKDWLTFTIITREADAFMSRLHTRMPVMLRPEVYDDWLNPPLRDDKGPLQVLTHGGDVALEAYPVSRRVNRVGEDEPSLIERVDYGVTRRSSECGHSDSHTP